MIPSWSLVITAGCLAVFSAVNLHNILRCHGRPTKGASEPEVPVPQGFTVGLVALGTGAFFLESLLYLLLGVLNRELSQLPMLDLPFMESDPFEFAGALIMTLGYAIFIWSVIVRGRYATSWTMPPEQQLVDWGPYRYVRHPFLFGLLPDVHRILLNVVQRSLPHTTGSDSRTLSCNDPRRGNACETIWRQIPAIQTESRALPPEDTFAQISNMSCPCRAGLIAGKSDSWADTAKRRRRG